MAMLTGLASAIGAGVGALIMGFGPYRVIAMAIVGFISGLLIWRYYLKQRLLHLDSFKKWR
jgi:hypothetical protein